MSAPLFGISGFKNSGKTTLTARLIAEFKSRGLSVSSVKHAHHDFDLDQAGTDTDQHRQAGAREVVIASARRWALMHEIAGGEKEPPLSELITHMAPCDLILAEGYKNETHPKIVLIANQEQAKLIETVSNIAAIVAPSEADIKTALPRFERDDVRSIADFIGTHLKLANTP